MKILGYLIAGIALFAVLILATGMLLPKKHAAAVRAQYDNIAPEAIFEVITSVADGPEWRTGLDSVKVLRDKPVTWTEYAEWGTLTMVIDRAIPSTLVVSRIADESEGFGGTWTYELMPLGEGTTVTITENGTVGNPLYRFMSRFVFGHYTALETYAKDLGRRFSQEIEPERVKH